MKKISIMLIAIFSGSIAMQAQVNPYTDEKPDFTEVSLGLPKNDIGAHPAMRTPPRCPSYCAYTFTGDVTSAYTGKVYYSAGMRRIYEIRYDALLGKQCSLTFVDSLVTFYIDHKAKTLERLDLSKMQASAAAAARNYVSMDNVSDSDEIVSYSDRWCRQHSAIIQEKVKDDYGGRFSAIADVVNTDLETGIPLFQSQTASAGGSRLMEITIGEPYPDVFELPKGYKLIQSDMNQVMDMILKMKKEGKDPMEELFKQMKNPQKNRK